MRARAYSTNRIESDGIESKQKISALPRLRREVSEKGKAKGREEEEEEGWKGGKEADTTEEKIGRIYIERRESWESRHKEKRKWKGGA